MSIWVPAARVVALSRNSRAARLLIHALLGGVIAPLGGVSGSVIGGVSMAKFSVSTLSGSSISEFILTIMSLLFWASNSCANELVEVASPLDEKVEVPAANASFCAANSCASELVERASPLDEDVGPMDEGANAMDVSAVPMLPARAESFHGSVSTHGSLPPPGPWPALSFGPWPDS